MFLKALDDKVVTIQWPNDIHYPQKIISWSFMFTSCLLYSNFGICSPNLFTNILFRNHNMAGYGLSFSSITSFLVIICSKHRSFSWTVGNMGREEDGATGNQTPVTSAYKSFLGHLVGESSLCVLFVFSWLLDRETTCLQCVLWGLKWQCANGALSAPTRENLDLISLRGRLTCSLSEASLWFRHYRHNMQHSNIFIY